jgi:hypothetical protein
LQSSLFCNKNNGIMCTFNLVQADWFFLFCFFGGLREDYAVPIKDYGPVGIDHISFS